MRKFGGQTISELDIASMADDSGKTAYDAAIKARESVAIASVAKAAAIATITSSHSNCTVEVPSKVVSASRKFLAGKYTLCRSFLMPSKEPCRLDHMANIILMPDVVIDLEAELLDISKNTWRKLCMEPHIDPPVAKHSDHMALVLIERAVTAVSYLLASCANKKTEVEDQPTPEEHNQNCERCQRVGSCGHISF